MGWKSHLMRLYFKFKEDTITNLILATIFLRICLLCTGVLVQVNRLTHPTCTHTQQWTHTRSSALSGEQLGVQRLPQGHLSHGIEGEESAVHSLPPPTIPAGPRLELATFRLPVRLSNIRPQLPYTTAQFHKVRLIKTTASKASTN